MQVCVLHERWPAGGRWALPAGVTSVALTWEMVAARVSHLDVDAEGLRASLGAAGVKPLVVELPPLTCLDGESFERETDDAYMRLQVVERLGAPLAVIASGHEGEIGFDLTVDALTRLAALAERMDVRLSVRNVCGSALEQPESLHALFAKVRSVDLGLCLDVLEFAQAVVNPVENVAVFADRLAAACVPARAVPVLRVTETSIRSTLEELKREGFAGPVIVEAREAEHFLAMHRDHMT